MNAKRCILAVWAITAVCVAATPAFSAEPVTLKSLLEDMVDRSRVARYPTPSYVCRQASSYDRDMVSPDEPGWFANWDRSQFIRQEENNGRTEWVLMDAQGPGAVVRFWGTWHGPGGGPFSNGTMRVYLDGTPEPAIEGPIADLISGGALCPAPLSNSVSPESPYERRGHNLYLPIPYAEHCKITYESDKLTDIGGKQGEALYYQINYRTYESGTEVESFSREQLAELKPVVERVGRRLLESGIAQTESLEYDQVEETLAPGEERAIELDGPAAIRQLTLRIEAEDLPQALRSTVLEATFDGEPSIWCPIGEFFGTGYGIHPYQTWYTRVEDDGTMTAFWVMPFEKSARVAVRNLGEQEVRVVGAGRVGDWDWDDRSTHFHSVWRQYTEVDTGPDKDMTGQGAFDVNYVEISGQGQYVGDTLTVFNGIAAWWGEGDEKSYIDGESFPSHVGTGTEDYYGYAWCRPEFFDAPFHAQPNGSGNLESSLTVNNRYRILDCLPFEKSLKVDMELWHWRSTVVNYAPTTFWYARPGADGNVAPDAKTAALPVARKRSDIVEVFQVPGAIEGESLSVVDKTGGTIEIQSISEFRWSNDQQLWWRDAEVGDKLVLEVPVEEAGTYRVFANLTKAVDYGIVRLTLAGRAVPEEFDRFAPQVSHDLLELGEFTLEEGPAELVVEIVGAHPDAVKRHMFGLDYLKLEKVD